LPCHLGDCSLYTRFLGSTGKMKATQYKVVATIETTINNADQPIGDFAQASGVSCFREGESNVMARALGAAESAAEVIVEITGDRTIIDPYYALA